MKRNNTYHTKAAAARGEVIVCKGCLYYKNLSGGGKQSMHACHYALDTGTLRLIPAKDCYLHANTPYTEEKS